MSLGPGIVALGLVFAATAAGAATGRLEVRVVDAEGTPAPGARVTVTERGTNRVLERATDGKGLATFLGLAGGEVFVRVEKEGCQIVERNAGLQVGAVARVEVALAPRRRVLTDEEMTPEQRTARRATELYNAAVGQFQAGDDAAASRGVDEALGLDPSLAEAHVLKARLLSNSGDHGAAADRLIHALDLDPDRHEILPGLIGELQLAGRHTEAAVYTERFESLAPDTPQGQYDLALAKINAGDDAAALRLLEQVIERAPEHAAAYYQRALIRLRAGATPGAIEDLRRYLEGAPEGAFAKDARELLAALSKK